MTTKQLVLRGANRHTVLTLCEMLVAQGVECEQKWTNSTIKQPTPAKTTWVTQNKVNYSMALQTVAPDCKDWENTENSAGVCFLLTYDTITDTMRTTCSLAGQDLGRDRFVRLLRFYDGVVKDDTGPPGDLHESLAGYVTVVKLRVPPHYKDASGRTVIAEAVPDVGRRLSEDEAGALKDIMSYASQRLGAPALESLRRDFQFQRVFVKHLYENENEDEDEKYGPLPTACTLRQMRRAGKAAMREIQAAYRLGLPGGSGGRDDYDDLAMEKEGRSESSGAEQKPVFEPEFGV